MVEILLPWKTSILHALKLNTERTIVMRIFYSFAQMRFCDCFPTTFALIGGVTDIKGKISTLTIDRRKILLKGYKKIRKLRISQLYSFIQFNFFS